VPGNLKPGRQGLQFFDKGLLLKFNRLQILSGRGFLQSQAASAGLTVGFRGQSVLLGQGAASEFDDQTISMVGLRSAVSGVVGSGKRFF